MMDLKAEKYSVVIPVYNSTASLRLLAQRICTVFEQEGESAFEILLVDDGSTEPETWRVIETLANQHRQVRAFQLMRNFGKNAALLCGMEHARGAYIITMDDDLQHRPEDIPSLMKLSAYDVVIGKFRKKKHPLVKQMFSSLNNWLEATLIGKPAHIESGPFRMYKKEVVKAMLQMKTSYPSISAQTYYVTRKVVNVEVSHDERIGGPTSFTFFKSLGVFSNTIINNSSLLLKIIASIGIVFSMASFGLGTFYIIKKLTVGTRVEGWASLMVAILFIGGLILFSVGVVGEYLIRIIHGVERKPLFILRQSTDEKEKTSKTLNIAGNGD